MSAKTLITNREIRVNEVFYSKIDSKLSLPEMEVLAEMLSAEKRRRFYSLRNPADRQRLITGDMLVKRVLTEKLHCMPQELNFCSNSDGKPCLMTPNGIFFNLSHSGNYAVAVFSDEETGIDIEEIKPVNDQLKVARVFMSDKEYSLFSVLPEKDRQPWFYRLWTAKESFVKNTGRGVFEGLQSITIDFSGKRIMVYKDEKLLPGYYFQEFSINPRYALFICGNSEPASFFNRPLFISKKIIYLQTF